ncbi:MAG: hypothetical protein Q8R87_03990 [Anaerolineaceae bacterium]|nr:hypothetical protein [Anaerolineaceae bacterium]
MRHTKTFILRLYTDQDLREKTCGNLQALPGRKAHSFRNNTELLNLLKHLSNEEETELPLKGSQNANEPK